jgi:hypothetical protein
MIPHVSWRGVALTRREKRLRERPIVADVRGENRPPRGSSVLENVLVSGAAPRCLVYRDDVVPRVRSSSAMKRGYISSSRSFKKRPAVACDALSRLGRLLVSSNPLVDLVPVCP